MLRSLPRSAKIFLFSECFFGFASGVIALNLNFFLYERSFNNYHIGLLSMASSVAMALFSLLAGGLADRKGCYPILIGGSFLQGAGFLLTAYAPVVPLLIAGQVMQSGGSACVRTCEFPYVTGLVHTERDKKNVYFLLIYFFCVSNVAGSLAGGFLPQFFAESENAYFYPVIIGGIMFAAMGLARFRLVRDAGGVKGTFAGVKNKLSNQNGGRIFWYVVFLFLFRVASTVSSSQLNLVYKNRFLFPDQLIGILFSVSSIITLVSLTFLPYLLERFSAHKIALATLAVNIVSLFFSAFSLPVLFVAMIFVRACFLQFFGMTFEQPMLVSVPAEGRGFYSGMRLSFSAAGDAAGSFIAGYFLSFSSYGLMMGFCIVIFGFTLLSYQLRCKKYMYGALNGSQKKSASTEAAES